MVRATGQEESSFCMACFTGKYPIPVDASVDKYIMERRRSRGNLLMAEDEHPELFRGDPLTIVARTLTSKLQRSASPKAYAQAGVDVDLGNRVKSGIQALVKGTHGPEVLGRIGGFGGLFRPDLRGMKEPVLVSSVDGVGTKLKLAFQTGRHDTVGQDLVNTALTTSR
jgi:hypothetical protein